MTRPKTLAGKTRRYRIYVAATNGKEFKGWEFITWVTKHWRMLADHLGETDKDDDSMVGKVCHHFGGGYSDTQDGFDNYIEGLYGIAAETDPYPERSASDPRVPGEPEE